MIIWTTQIKSRLYEYTINPISDFHGFIQKSYVRYPFHAMNKRSPSLLGCSYRSVCFVNCVLNHLGPCPIVLFLIVH